MTIRPAKDIRVVIIHETARQSWMRDASTYALVVALIGTGVALDSAAMQWVGFCILAMGALRIISKIKSRTIAEAREVLDSWEAEQRNVDAMNCEDKP